VFYKEANFRQDPAIGRIPKEWEAVRLEEVAEIRKNKTTSGLEKIAFIPMELISESQILAQYQVRRKEDVKSSIYCEVGDLLLAKITPSLENGKQGIVPSDVPNRVALATTEVFPISCKGIDRLFLYHVLKSSKFRNKIISSMIGTTGRQRASKESVEKLTIPLPPIREQEKIVEVLGIVDLAVAKTGEVVAKTERLKKGLMQELLTKGIGHKEYKDTPIGKTPKTWETVEFQGILSRIQNGLYVSKESGEVRCQLVRMTELFQSEILQLGDMKEVSVSKAEFENYSLNEGDLLFARRSLKIEGSGKCTIVPRAMEPIIFESSIIRVTLKKDIAHPKFFLTYFNSPIGRKLIRRITRTVAVSGITGNDLKKLRVPLPRIGEQRQITDILSILDEKLELEKKEKARQEKIKRGLMDLLLTGKIRVKVD
jgi:type I restriction enzyme S subunit